VVTAPLSDKGQHTAAAARGADPSSSSLQDAVTAPLLARGMDGDRRRHRRRANSRGVNTEGTGKYPRGTALHRMDAAEAAGLTTASLLARGMDGDRRRRRRRRWTRAN
jgi:hypothetical protein